MHALAYVCEFCIYVLFVVLFTYIVIIRFLKFFLICQIIVLEGVKSYL